MFYIKLSDHTQLFSQRSLNFSVVSYRMFGAGFRSLASTILVVNVVAKLKPKEQMRHRSVSWRQHGFLVKILPFKVTFTRLQVFVALEVSVASKVYKYDTIRHDTKYDTMEEFNVE